jgi:hypothetical protein
VTTGAAAAAMFSTGGAIEGGGTGAGGGGRTLGRLGHRSRLDGRKRRCRRGRYDRG